MAVESFYLRFGKVIREHRLKFGLSTEDLAEMVGYTRVSISNIEAGRQRPPLHIAILICKTLHIPEGTLFQ